MMPSFRQAGTGRQLRPMECTASTGGAVMNAAGHTLPHLPSHRRGAAARGSRWLTVGLTCLTTLLPLSIAACAEPSSLATGGAPTAAVDDAAKASSAPAHTAAPVRAADSAIATAIGKRIESDTPVVVAGRSYPASTYAVFYQSRNNEPVWVTSTGLSPRGTSLVGDLKHVDQEGFDPRLYLPAELPAAGASADDLAQVELELSAGLVRYANDARIGLAPPSRNDPNQSAPEKVIDPTAVLLSAASAPDMSAFVDGLSPQDWLYQGLREALHRYRALEQSGAWESLTPAMGLQPGANSDHVRRLRQALALMGDLPASADVHSTHYDDAVTGAVRRFQRRNNLAASGTVDAATRTAYNVPPSDRVEQIKINMERRRWMPTELGSNYILVNLPNYTLNVVEDGKPVMEMRVVVGKPDWPTPVFSDIMQYVEFNPYWTVPPGIIKKEVLPKMRSNPGYASATGLKVYRNGKEVAPADVDWSAAGTNYSFRQDPGERNALGRMAFMFPNQYSVYLHDTPSKALFARSSRAFSHGCVRVEKPRELAEYLLSRNDDGWSQQRIDRTIQAQKNSSIRLKDPLPIHLTYFTVWLDSDGNVQFRNDIYQRDTTLARSLSASAD